MYIPVNIRPFFRMIDQVRDSLTFVRPCEKVISSVHARTRTCTFGSCTIPTSVFYTCSFGIVVRCMQQNFKFRTFVIHVQKRLSTESGLAFPEDTPVATKRAKGVSGGEESDESAAGGGGRRGSFGRRRRRKSGGRRMSFGGLRRAAAG